MTYIKICMQASRRATLPPPTSRRKAGGAGASAASPGWWLAVLASMLALLSGVGHAAAEPVPQNLPSITLQAGMYNIQAEVARTPDERATGLMYRREMPAHVGMLFVFEQAQPQCFWMKNTILPLSIAFLADDGSVVNVADMQPQTLDAHCSAQPVRYALEMNQGWFAKRGIKAGFKLTGGPFKGR